MPTFFNRRSPDQKEMEALLTTWLRFKEQKLCHLLERFASVLNGAAASGIAEPGRVYRAMEKRAVSLAAERLNAYAAGDGGDDDLIPLLSRKDFAELEKEFADIVNDKVKDWEKLGISLTAAELQPQHDMVEMRIDDVIGRLVFGETPYDAMLTRVDGMTVVASGLGIPYATFTLTEDRHDCVVRALHARGTFERELRREAESVIRFLCASARAGLLSTKAAADATRAARIAIDAFVVSEMKRVWHVL